MTPKKEDPNNRFGDAETEAQSIDGSSSKISDAFGAKHQFDWSEVAYLFDGGEVPEELAAITDPIEYNYLLVRLRKEFNEKHKSNYLKYMNLQLPYHSRRDEVGGAITEKDWQNFITRLEGIIARVERKRKRIIRRRKARGKKKMPRKTLFKPKKQPNLMKDPLWKEIFIDSQNVEESESDSGDDDNFVEIYKQFCLDKGLKVDTSILKETKGKQDVNENEIELINRDQNPDLTLPPIRHPSMHPREKPFKDPQEELMHEKRMKKRNKEFAKQGHKNASANLTALVKDYPQTAKDINMKFVPTTLPTLVTRDKYAPQRTIKKEEAT